MNNENALTPVMQQYVQLKNCYKAEILFFRLGDFYEMFNEDAKLVSKLLNLTLTHRGTAPMCGIPAHASKIYIARLLRLGKKIAICEQIGNPKTKGLTERKVVEVITPGTAVDSEYLEGNSNNYLAAFTITKGIAGFAFIDVTTSFFAATSWKNEDTAENLSKELGRCSPRELILPDSLKNNSVIQNIIAANPEISISYYPDWDFNAELSYKLLTNQFNTINLKPFGLLKTSAEVPPAGFLLDYLTKTTSSSIPHISGLHIYSDDQYLIIDDSSRRNLEITSNLRDGSLQYSLLECVNHAKTAMGSRMIKNRLLYPLTDYGKILERQNHISLFTENRNLMEFIREKLSPILDIERLAGRIAMEKAHPKDLKALQTSLEAWMQIHEKLAPYDFKISENGFALEIIDLIENSIKEDPAVSISEGKIIKDGWSEELDKWKEIHGNFDKILAEYEQEERENTGISNLKIKYNNALGYFIEVTKGKLSSVPQNFIMRRSLLNGERYTTPRLQELEHKLTESGTKILELEKQLFIEIRNKLCTYVPFIMQTASEIAYIDTSSSFAQAAIFHNWTKPVIYKNPIFKVNAGRHPIVEYHLPQGEFIPNDLYISAEKKEKDICSFALITGPNMAGKSTFLRQNALIMLLAQTGSFVPAESAQIGIADRIFCRVGASDNLSKGESTFLVEMTETANILRSATDKSLVIMDEVGRGTSTEDGLSIAWAVSEYLLNSLNCRTLFATHYHELTRIENDSLKLLCMDVSEERGTVTFLRKIKDGAAANSYGIHVAKLAGIPKEVIERASQILEEIQNSAQNKFIISEKNFQPQIKTVSLFSEEEIILNEILSTDLDNLTPLNALQTIARWKNELSGK